jgi:quercetin dioxygenase-like cupin family protein
VLSGHLEVKAAGRTFNLHPGGLLALDRNQAHEVLALNESVVLLTIAWPGREND